MRSETLIRQHRDRLLAAASVPYDPAHHAALSPEDYEAGAAMMRSQAAVLDWALGGGGNGYDRVVLAFAEACLGHEGN